MKNKLLIIFIYLFLNSILFAGERVPFKNINYHKEPIQYEKITFENYEGKKIELKNIDSKIYIINFWATWCAPCKEEMPSLDILQKDKDIEIIAINLEEKNKNKVDIFFKSLNIKNLTNYYDPELNLVKNFKIRGVPTSIIFNKDQKEIARIIGDIDFSDKEFISWLKDIT